MTQRGRQAPRADRMNRRRGRELALQVLFSLDMAPAEGPQGVTAALYRNRERALIAEAELGFVAGDEARAKAATDALLVLDKRHARGKEYLAALERRGPTPLPPGDDEREEHEALAASDDNLAFCDAVTRGVLAARDAIDGVIGEVSTNWRVPRMALVDRNILRIAVYELQSMPETPVRVILNEAIEIAKRFGTQESRAFINGVLDRLAAKIRPEETAAPRGSQK